MKVFYLPDGMLAKSSSSKTMMPLIGDLVSPLIALAPANPNILLVFFLKITR